VSSKINNTALNKPLYVLHSPNFIMAPLGEALIMIVLKAENVDSNSVLL
jgi:hypothetical protein